MSAIDEHTAKLHAARPIVGLLAAVLLGAMVPTALADRPEGGADAPATRETRPLSSQEADKLLEEDWLFQADGAPTPWRTRQEIAWARELAARLANHSKAPDLSAELAELDRLQRRVVEAVPNQGAIKSLPAGLRARWTFDQLKDGAVEDASGGGAHGKVNGQLGLDAGVAGSGLRLDGRGVVVTDPRLAAVTGGDYTACAWVKTTAKVMDVLGSGVGAGHMLIVINKGPVRAHHWTDRGGAIFDGKAVVNDGRWHHVAQVVEGARLALYVDGKLDHSVPLEGPRKAAADPIVLGARTLTDTAYRFRGSMDEVCLFDRALSAVELKSLFDQGHALVKDVPADDPELYLAVRRVKRRMMLADPRIDFSQVLLVDVPCYDALNHESMHRVFPQAQNNVGRLLVLEGLGPGAAVRNLGPGPGMYWRPDLSFDARTVLFSHRPAKDRTFHLYRIGLDGSGLEQLTSAAYDDLDPIFMPDGNIIFLSNRGNSYARCAVGHPSYVVTRCDSQGKNIYIISASNEPEYTPAVLHDGRVLYTRWEYTDKELMRIQSLWTVNPDGTGVATFWGNQSYWPDMIVEARPIPGSRRVIFSGQGHHDVVHGCIGIIDPKAGFNYPDGLTKVTADRPWAETGFGPADRAECDAYHGCGAYDGYRCPYPLSEDLFLVSAHRPGGRFALYLMDVCGNRELLYRGEHDALYAQPVRPRPAPPVVPDTVPWPGSESEGRPVPPGALYSANVLQGMPEQVRGKARYLRVINLDYTTFTFGLKTQGPGYWGWNCSPHMHAGPPMSITGNDGIKRILGTVPIAEDGSVHFEVPPGKQVHFQLLDENYRALQTMRSFTNVMPGERRGCVGCHEMHSVVPVAGTAAALKRGPVKPVPPPWGPHYNLGYRQDIQPILDRHCGKCHREDEKARQKIDFTLRPSPDAGIFPEPYVTLTLGARRNCGGHFPHNCEGGIAGTILPMVYPNPPEEDRTLPPMTTLSYTSPLVKLASSGEHYGAKLDPLSLRKLIVWVDMLCPYWSEQDIRAMPDPDPADPFYANSGYPPRTPGVRPFADSPYPPKMRSAPVVKREYRQDEFRSIHDRLRGAE